ncbi:MAG: HIT domain-containing protein [Deltaproteobacteria bacterium]|nr:HIT domain-containing protein [Deltaproteobacteria bacterium]
MKQLWAPWRAEYILGQKPSQCIFCKDYSKDDTKELVLYRGKLAAVMMNKFPYNNGHLLVYPWRHTSLLEDIEKEETLELFKLIKESVAILKKEMNPGGFNIGMNLGKEAGAGIEEHLHFHIVPRWNGDTNFMPVIGEVRVLPEHLQATYDKLYPHFQKIKSIN